MKGLRESKILKEVRKEANKKKERKKRKIESGKMKAKGVIGSARERVEKKRKVKWEGQENVKNW